MGVALRLESVSKHFGGVRALEDVSLELEAGQVLGLIGENGAGKSTLIKILNGVHRADGGRIFLGDEEVSFGSPAEALRAGIATVHQESSLVPNLSVATNLMLAHESASGNGSVWVSDRRTRREAEDLVKRTGFELPLDIPAAELSVAQRQLVEIARSLAMAATVLILDEPTAALSPDEVAVLFDAIRSIRDQGVPVIYVSHRLEEIPLICDRVMVLRNGQVAGEVPGSEATHDRLVPMMIGRDLQALFPEREGTAGDEVLEVVNLKTSDLKDISLTVRQGEIVGLVGALGGGQREAARAIVGVDDRSGGSVHVDGRPVHANDARAAIAVGVAYITGDRRDSTHPGLAIESNLALPWLQIDSRYGFVRGRSVRKRVEELIDVFRIRTTGPDQLMADLSGGNQQKILFARWAPLEPRLFVLDDPTLGVDIGSKSEIYQLLRELTAQGAGVLLVSSDIDEVIHTADRIVVMRHGAIVAEVAGATATEAEIVRLAHGFSTAETA
jgi:ABC-type sugar transport system ATPase subunit